MLLVMGSQGLEHAVVFGSTQQPEQRVNPGGGDDVDPFIAGDRRAEELRNTWPRVVAGSGGLPPLGRLIYEVCGRSRPVAR